MGSLKKDSIIFIIIVIIFLLFILTIEPPKPKEFVNDKAVLNYSNALFDYKIMRYPTSIEIGSPEDGNVNLGFVTDPWNLKFGVIPGNGSYVRRYVNIKNSKEKYSLINLEAYGNISSMINFSKNNFVLNENESAAVEIDLYTNSSEPGNYSGEIDIIIKVPKYDFLDVLM